ncbi:MAG: HAD-IA family hydrolase [Saccharothrix sp.]|nr:HAD-IA family hydrolase [Saccharothrix sp.]
MIFDFFGVIARLADPAGRRAIEETVDLDPAVLWEGFLRHRRAYDLDEIDGHRFWEAVLGTRLTPTQAQRLVDLDVASLSTVDANAVEVVRELRRRPLRLALLSNLPVDLLQWHRANTPVLAEFDVVHASCRTGLGKPDPAAFTSVLRDLGVRADRAVLVDDHEPNIEAAGRLGIRGVHVTPTTDLRAELADALAPALADTRQVT